MTPLLRSLRLLLRRGGLEALLGTIAATAVVAGGLILLFASLFPSPVRAPRDWGPRIDPRKARFDDWFLAMDPASRDRAFLQSYLSSVPALILYGAADTFYESVPASLHAALRGSIVVRFERSGHWCFLEESDRFKAVVAWFLKEANL